MQNREPIKDIPQVRPQVTWHKICTKMMLCIKGQDHELSQWGYYWRSSSVINAFIQKGQRHQRYAQMHALCPYKLQESHHPSPLQPDSFLTNQNWYSKHTSSIDGSKPKLTMSKMLLIIMKGKRHGAKTRVGSDAELDEIVGRASLIGALGFFSRALKSGDNGRNCFYAYNFRM